MPNGYETFADAMLAAVNGPKDGSYAGEKWEPLQCVGCGQWFPVLGSAVEMLATFGQAIRMECAECGDGQP